MSWHKLEMCPPFLCLQALFGMNLENKEFYNNVSAQVPAFPESLAALPDAIVGERIFDHLWR